MRALLNSTAPFWVAVFLLVCLLLFAVLVACDEYVRHVDEREERRRQHAIYDAEGLA